jgi:phosphomannomutase
MNSSLGLLKKSYDLRGIYPTQIDAVFFTLVGKAFGSWAPAGEIIIGGDARVSTPELKSAMIAGLVSTGRVVRDIGLVSSDMLQFASIHHAETTAMAIMVTASHNPKDYNGFKCCLTNAGPIDLQKVGPELIAIIDGDNLLSAEGGQVIQSSILEAWIDRVSSFVTTDLSGLRIVADAGNGTAGVFMSALAERLGFELTPLYFEPDGNFPNHHPSPIEAKNMVDLQARVISEWADIGVAFDGDADRAVLCDSAWVIITPSITMAAITEHFLHLHPGWKILTNTPTSHIVRDTVERLGGICLVERVGHVYLKSQMEKDPEIIFGGEHSSHYFFPSLGNLDSGLVAFVIFLEYMGQFELTAEWVRKRFSKYANIEETNFTVSSVSETIELLASKYTDGAQDRTDGLTVTYPDWWMSVRGSSNEPLIRLNIEANSPQILETQKRELLSIIEARAL